MIKKTIEYVDYNDEVRKEDFYFNLNSVELLELQYSEVGGLDKVLEKIAETKEEGKLVKFFKEIILSAYGEPSADGKHFVKSEELRTLFSQSEAFVTLFTELSTDDVKAAEFINGIMPKKIKDSIKTNS